MRNIAAFLLAISADGRPGCDHRFGDAVGGRSGGDPDRLGLLLAVIAAIMLLCFGVFDFATAASASCLGSTATLRCLTFCSAVPGSLAAPGRHRRRVAIAG